MTFAQQSTHRSDLIAFTKGQSTLRHLETRRVSCFKLSINLQDDKSHQILHQYAQVTHGTTPCASTKTLGLNSHHLHQKKEQATRPEGTEEEFASTVPQNGTQVRILTTQNAAKKAQCQSNASVQGTSLKVPHTRSINLTSQF